VLMWRAGEVQSPCSLCGSGARLDNNLLPGLWSRTFQAGALSAGRSLCSQLMARERGSEGERDAVRDPALVLGPLSSCSLLLSLWQRSVAGSRLFRYSTKAPPPAARATGIWSRPVGSGLPCPSTRPQPRRAVLLTPTELSLGCQRSQPQGVAPRALPKGRDYDAQSAHRRAVVVQADPMSRGPGWGAIFVRP
jgi:hypothetical protein